MGVDMAIGGHCDPRFFRVREVFERHFAEGAELGAAFTVFLDGERVVDLWGGVADRTTGRAWGAHTPVLAYSCTKAVTATALLLLAERGLIDVAAPIREYWPEFGTASVTVEHVLTHQAGLPAIEEQVPVAEFEDQPAIAARIAAQTPVWEPGTAHGYHAVTYGFLVGEIIRRVTGKSAGDVVSAEIAGPRGLELWLGAPPDVIERTARLSAGERTQAEPVIEVEDGDPANPMTAIAAAARDRDSLMNRALGNPSVHLLPGGANNPVILRAGWPAMGMVATARGLAAFYADLIAGRILRPETLSDAVRRRVRGPDRVLYIDSSFGLGYMRPALTFLTPAAGEETAFGHTGLGGSIGLGDVENGLGVAYTMNKLADAVGGSLRAYHLVAATYDSL
ncbi:serine hydrolase domain-containing protein [Acrocarpospora corrugata]|nr:serine hydrolase domain-containing protein [Acrocarpospora corrugata]